MAADLGQDSVIFTGTSTVNIVHAKEFWRAIDGNFDEKSSLFVSGVDHRLHTASLSNNRAILNTRKATSNILNPDEKPGLAIHKSEANRRLKIEEQEYVHRVLDQKKQQRDLIKKRRDERLAKETIRESSRGTFVEELSKFEADDKIDMEDEGFQAMKDIENFERMAKITNERKKEKQ